MSYNKNTDWDNEQKYLENLINSGSDGEKAWAQNQLGVLNQAKAQYGGTSTAPTTTASPYNENTNWANENAYLTDLSKNGSAGEQAWANNQLNILNNAMAQYGITSTPTTGNTYTPTGTHNDSGMSAEDKAQIEAFQKAYAEALAKGDTKGMQMAHDGAESIRNKYGYSGGEDGSDYLELTSPKDILSWNENYNASNAKPTYTSKYDPQIETLLNEILTREDFSYNVESDPLYAQYKAMYNREGDRAMRDTLAEVASSAGGMNSYAITAAQQANNYYNSQLNDRIPELYQLAYEMYLQDKESKVQDLGILTQLDGTQYNRYRDTMSDWKADKDFAYDAYKNAITQGNNEQSAAKDDVWKLISLGVTPSADLIAKSGMSQIDIDLAVAAMKAGGTGNNGYTGGGTGGSGGNGYTGGSGGTGGDNTGGDNTGFTGNDTAVIDGIKKKCSEITSNIELGNYIDGLVATGTISSEYGDQLYAQYVDDNEKYIDEVDDKGNKTQKISYSGMLKSTKGWEVVNDGGFNWLWGVDEDAIVKAPNGEQIRLDNLVNKLVAEGMSKSAAQDAVIELQKNLQI